MTEPTIICPNCKTEIKLTESLAAPFDAGRPVQGAQGHHEAVGQAQSAD